MIICRRQRHMIERCQMHAFRCYIFAARIACDSGPTCQSPFWLQTAAYELKVDKNAGFKCQHYLLFVNSVVFLIIGQQHCVSKFLSVTLNCIWQPPTPDIECTFMPYPTIRLIRKSNRIVDFYLKLIRNQSSI